MIINYDTKYFLILNASIGDIFRYIVINKMANKIINVDK